MKFTAEQKRAIKRICEEYDFENVKELKDFLKSSYGDILDAYWFRGTSYEECYKELESVVNF